MLNIKLYNIYFTELTAPSWSSHAAKQRLVPNNHIQNSWLNQQQANKFWAYSVPFLAPNNIPPEVQKVAKHPFSCNPRIHRVKVF